MGVYAVARLVPRICTSQKVGIKEGNRINKEVIQRKGVVWTSELGGR